MDRSALPLAPAAGAGAGGPEVPTRALGPTLGALLGLASAAWGLLVGLGPLRDNSFFTHLATGRLILDGWSVPSTDPYSFTAHGHAFLVQSWLPSLLYAVVERLAGGVGLSMLMGLTCAAVAWLCWHLTASASGSALARVGVLVPVALVGTQMWSERPLLFGLLGLGVVLLAGDGRLDPRWLVPAGWLWANSHGSWPYGLLVLVLLAVGARLDGQRPVVELRALRWLAVGLAAGAIGPLGPRILLAPVAALSKREVFSFIVEWQPPRFDGAWQYAFLVSVVLGIVALVRRPSWRRAVPFVVFLVLALTALRNMSVFQLVALAGTAAGFADLGTIDDRRRAPVFRAGVAGLAALVAVIGVAGLGRAGVDAKAYPVDALAWLDARTPLREPGRRVLTPDAVGNYLELSLGRDAQVFFDDRVDMYPVSVALDYRAVSAVQTGWDEVLDRWGITSVVWLADRPLAHVLDASSSWTQVWSDDEWAIFDRA